MSVPPQLLRRSLVVLVSQVVAFASVLGASAAPGMASDPAVPMCDGKVATIVGTEGDDVLRGTNKADVIVGLGGDDVIIGGNGDDIICGGPGNDRIEGGNGDDRLFGEDGDDVLLGGNGQDVLVGGAGNDELFGENGADELDGGRGVDHADGGRGPDRCAGSETTVNCETVVPADEEITLALDVTTDCVPGLVVDATGAEMASDGDVVAYDVTVRNDPEGACLTFGSTQSTVSGTVTVTSSHPDDVAVSDLSVWLELHGSDGPAVLPFSSGLTTSGGEAPEGCPGGTADGCSATIGDVVGNVDFPDGDDVTLQPDDAAQIPFRFFPTLQGADIDAIRTAEHVTVAFGAVADGERLIVRQDMTFADAPASGPVTVTAELPTGPATVSLPAVVPGDQVTATGVTPFTVAPEHPDRITATFTASDGAVTSAPVTVGTTVVLGPDRIPVLQPAVWPRALTAGLTSEVTVSVSPVGDVDGPVVARGPQGEVTLVDDGTDPDLTPEDNVWTAVLPWTPAQAGTESVEVTAVVDGVPVSGTATIAVLPDGVPASPEVLPTFETVVDAGSEFLPDRIVLHTATDANPLDVVAAAAAVDGEIVGLVAPGIWQVAVPPVTSKAAIDTVLEAVSAHPVVIGAEPSGAVRLDVVEPQDTLWGEQTNLTSAKVDDAWVFQTGRARSLTIAIIDSGVNLDHEDLADKVLRGYDFRDGDDDPDDAACYHGSHVAGIAAASANNGVGIAGVSWKADLLPVRVFPVDKKDPNKCGSSRTEDIAAAVDYSVARGASVINLSLSGPNRNETLVKALAGALDANRIVVAAAGNQSEDVRRYPAGYERSERFTSWFGLNPRTYALDVIAVGNADDNGRRAESSNYGRWVDVVAPGVSVMSTTEDGTYSRKTGTSMATPLVAGVVALMRAEDWTLTPGQARHRLVSTGRQRDIVSGPDVDAYGAVANASFESGLEPWRHTGTVKAVGRLGPIKPIRGDRMLSLSSGPGTAETRATVTRTFRVPSDNLSGDQLSVGLYFNFVSEEYPEFVNTGYNDTFTVDLVLPDGTTERLVDESVNTTAWTPVSGIDFPGGDATVGQSGWRWVSTTIDAERLRGVTTFELVVSDVGDSAYDSVGLIDEIRVS